MNAVEILNEDLVIIVGGHNFDRGNIWITKGRSAELISIDTTGEYEFMDVERSSDGRIHVAGYGIMQYSDDQGGSWEISDIQGDFFQAVDFPSPETGYAVGLFGTIIKSSNNGVTWEKIRNGNSIFTSDLAFRDVEFQDEDSGFVVGHDGLFWRTENGGEDWEVIVNVPVWDYTNIQILNDHAYLSARGGHVIKVPLD